MLPQRLEVGICTAGTGWYLELSRVKPAQRLRQTQVKRTKLLPWCMVTLSNSLLLCRLYIPGAKMFLEFSCNERFHYRHYPLMVCLSRTDYQEFHDSDLQVSLGIKKTWENTRKQIVGSTPSCELSESERPTYLELICLADKQANEVGEEVSCSWQCSWSESNSLSLGSRPGDQHMEDCAPVCAKVWSWWDWHLFYLLFCIYKNEYIIMLYLWPCLFTPCFQIRDTVHHVWWHSIVFLAHSLVVNLWENFWGLLSLLSKLKQRCAGGDCSDDRRRQLSGIVRSGELHVLQEAAGCCGILALVVLCCVLLLFFWAAKFVAFLTNFRTETFFWGNVEDKEPPCHGFCAWKFLVSSWTLSFFGQESVLGTDFLTLNFPQDLVYHAI